MALLYLLLSTIFCAGLCAPAPGLYSFFSAAQPNLALRHCDYVAFATPFDQSGPNDDFRFNMIPALNGNSGAVSLQSFDFPDHFFAADSTGRLGIVTTPNVDQASFLVVPGLSNSNLASLTALDPRFSGQYVTLSSKLSGACAGNYQPPAGDVVYQSNPLSAFATWTLKSSPVATPSFNVRANSVTHQVDSRYLGCHSDSGYTHQPRGFYSQMIFGESFEEPWNQVVRAGVSFSSRLDNNVQFNNKPSLNLQYNSGSGFAGVSNRGLGNEGLVFQANKDYEVIVFLRANQDQVVTARIDNYETGTTLSQKSINVRGSAQWTQYSFSLHPSSSTNCVGIAPGSDPNVTCGDMGPGAGHICVRCGGQFSIGLEQPGSLWVGYVFVQPGSWGRYKNLPVLLSAVETLQQMGITILRQGGTFAQTMIWKQWRGPATQRPSMQLKWGASLVSGWGPFEMIDLCNAAGIEVIITLSENQTPQDWADLVEYCFGNQTTLWGGLRYNDGHPQPYDVKIFELGNEQYNSQWVDQVQAMENKAKSLGMGGQLYYMFPTNQGLSPQDAQRAARIGAPISHFMPDIHIGAGGAIGVAIQDFNALPGFPQSAINCETNAGTHGQDRAVQEASDLNDWFNLVPPLNTRLFARTASFCNERSGHFDAFDQGISFFLPNMTWLQPPGYVHQMISQTWQPQGLFFNVTNQGMSSFSAQKSSDGRVLVVRFANPYPTPTRFQLTLENFNPQSTVTVWTLSSIDSNDANTPANPTKISPQKSTVRWTNGGWINAPENSFVVAQFNA